MPRKMWKVDFQCPFCWKSLRSKGIYHRVRLVMDMRDFYYLAAEYMECTGRDCIKTFISWDSRMLNQLVDGVQVPNMLAIGVF